MSTVDPAAERRRRELARSRSRSRSRGRIRGRDGGRGPALGLGTVLGLLVFGGAWCLFGVGIADMAAYPVGTGYLTEDTEPANDLPGFFWATFAGAFAGVLSGLGPRGRLAARIGLNLQGALSTAVVAVGISLGFFFGARSFWTPAPEPGVFVDATGLPGEEWGAAAWLAWTSRYWVPALLLCVAVLRIVLSLLYERVRRRREARTREILATGRRTRGEVTEAAATGIEVMGRPQVRFVVKFTDHRGTDRWVTKTGLFDRAAPPRPGDRAVIWFDPAAPGDERAIPVALAGLDGVDLDATDLDEVVAGGGLTIH
ncbi:hypothetical protein GCM10010232_47550 [Streptomyces amakusaensis]|uniref:DUF3592 domain-containing protein n=1 Tax=Streptomyces amakusaensis TaxID=67271 RepID=A0ABW0AHY2_9ACTN